MKKLYQVIFQDEYNNLSEIGWYESLDDSIEDVNDQISIYGKGQYKFKKGDLQETAGTFGWVADVELAYYFNNEDEDDDKSFDDFQGAMIRVFIHELKDEDFYKIKDIFVKEKGGE